MIVYLVNVRVYAIMVWYTVLVCKLMKWFWKLMRIQSINYVFSCTQFYKFYTKTTGTVKAQIPLQPRLNQLFLTLSVQIDVITFLGNSMSLINPGITSTDLFNSCFILASLFRKVKRSYALCIHKNVKVAARF